MVREKNRYIVVQILLENENETNVRFNGKILAKTIFVNVTKYYGEFGIATVENGFNSKYCNDQTRIAIFRCRHKAHRFVTSILPLITVIGDYRAKFRMLYVGATIMQCNKFILKYQQTVLSKIVGQIKSAKLRKDFIENVLEFQIDSE